VKFEDALLYVELTLNGARPTALDALCRAVAEGGADVLRIPSLEAGVALRDVVAQCHEEGMLTVSGADPETAAGAGVDGVCLDGGSGSIAVARAVLSEETAVGVTTHSMDELRLAVEVGVDFVLHMDGAGAPGAFAAIGRRAGALLYAAGIDSAATAEAVTASGIFRLAVRVPGTEPRAVQGCVAVYARLLGRCV
jgi:hypothetical protein